VLLKPVPIIEMFRPIPPMGGDREVIAKGDTRNSLTLSTVYSSRVTEIFPVVVPVGMVTVKDVGVALVMVALTPLNRTIWLDSVELNPVPVKVTLAPTLALGGVTVVRERIPPKSSELVAVVPLTVTEIFPAVFPVGILAVRLLGEAFVTVAVTPLNLTMLLTATPLKPLPVMTTLVPAGPNPGEKEFIAKGKTKNSLSLTVVVVSLATEILPVVAVAGTVTNKLVFVALVMLAFVPLIRYR
jgi:hypothetical protein